MNQEASYMTSAPAVSTLDGMITLDRPDSRLTVMPRRVAIALARRLLAGVRALEEQDGSRQHLLPFPRSD